MQETIRNLLIFKGKKIIIATIIFKNGNYSIVTNPKRTKIFSFDTCKNKKYKNKIIQ